MFLDYFDASHIAAGIVGGLSVAIATHYLTKDREKHRDLKLRQQATDDASAVRLRSFLAYLVQFRAETFGHQQSTGLFQDFYQQKVPDFRREFSLVSADFTGDRRLEFDRLVSVAAGFTKAQATYHTGKQQIVDAIDALIKFYHDT